MKTTPPIARRGAALIVVLAFIVLLTALVLTYFSYSTLQRQISSTSATQMSVQIFAHGAVSAIVSDLKQEIAAGSTSFTYGTNTVYLPLTQTNGVPMRVGTLDTLPNLVKRSSSSQAFYPSGPQRAANLSSTNVSQNGRLLSAARWNAALLLPKKDVGSVSDLTPISDFTAPDWVLVARDGSNPQAWDNNMRWSGAKPTTVVGRYAYAIYDEGGLLDANVAGFPPGAAPDQISPKGSLACADLTVLPGVTDSTVAALVGWRNYATAKPGGAFPSYTFNASSQTNYFQFVSKNTSGFKRTANTSLNNGQSDRLFLSRQQLIQFLTQDVPTSDAGKASLQNAMQYLATFSRDLEQPSFRSEPNLPNPALAADPKAARPKNTKFSPSVDGGNDAYDPTGALQDLINPNLLSARDASNNPVMKRRFPLSRLALLEQAAQTARSGGTLSADVAKQMLDYFGLTWDSAKFYWTYNHGNPAQIYKLSEIPAGREPDFFETLKSVINCDSLGKQHGGLDNTALTVSSSNVFSPHQFTGAGSAAIDSSVNYQIMQIGANLIDQYDADSYPTRLSFDPTGPLGTREFYGIENLPYLAGWELMWYRLKQLKVGGDINSAIYIKPTPPNPDVYPLTAASVVYETAAVVQPILWNPHAPDANPSPPDVPTAFRISAGAMTDTAMPTGFYPKVTPAWWTTVGDTFPATPAYAAANGMTVASGSLYRFRLAVVDPMVSFLEFNTGTGPASFREPYRLSGVNVPAGSNATNASGYTAGLIPHADATLVAAGEPNPAIGFFSGKCWTGPAVAGPGGGDRYLNQGQLLRGDMKFKLQYKDASGNWLTYDVIEQVYNVSGRLSAVDNTEDSPDHIRGFRTCFRADPRSDRWGLYSMETFPTTDMNKVPPADGTAISNGVTPGPTSSIGNYLYFLPQGMSWKPGATSSYYLLNNGSGPLAPGWLNSKNPPADLSINYYKTSPTGTLPGGKLCYTDPDGVLRRGSGGLYSGNDGMATYTGNYASRPVVLNRAFHSVAEMGCAFRGVAWKEVDFCMPESGDAGLLDAFCLNELNTAPGDLTVAGRVNLNTRQPKVLQALIQGVSKAEGGVLSSTEAQAAAEALVAWTTADPALPANVTSGIFNKGPLRNRSELVGKFVYQVANSPKPSLTAGGVPTNPQDPILDGSKSYSGYSSVLNSGAGGVFATSADAAIKRRRECVLRALADSGNTRTWNLLIDVVAQVGRYPATASALNQFIVEGETRNWVHIAIDRYTGEVVARQVEPVSE